MIQSSKFKTATVYPQDALEKYAGQGDVIDPAEFPTLPEAFAERVRRTPDKTACMQYDHEHDQWRDVTWSELGEGVSAWRRAFTSQGLAPGDRIAIMAPNSANWVVCDQAALAAGLVVVPVFTEDRADSVAYILRHSGVRMLFVSAREAWAAIKSAASAVDSLETVVLLDGAGDSSTRPPGENDSGRVTPLAQWLERGREAGGEAPALDADALATIIYTSGTTGKPKGVMLSHRNILSNAHAAIASVMVFPHDRFLSFLPLSHAFERTVGYYLVVLAGASVAFNRSIPDLMEDIAHVRPTVLITVPRIFEKAHTRIMAGLEQGPALRRGLFNLAVETGWRRFEYHQGRRGWSPWLLLWPLLNALVASKVRDRFGGRLGHVVCGGARLAPEISRVFIGLGLNILQGYGLTEASPVLATNTRERNNPSGIGLPLRGIQIRLGEQDELMARGPCVMLGYWNDPEATAGCIHDGWLATGDIAGISEAGFISITGRIKEIIVMANGKKAPPADIEAAICRDALFEQALVAGEGRSFLTAVVVVNAEAWRDATARLDLDPALDGEAARRHAMQRIEAHLSDFPGHEVIRDVVLTGEEWTIENGALTPTLKLRRPVLLERFRAQIDAMYPDSGGDS